MPRRTAFLPVLSKGDLLEFILVGLNHTPKEERQRLRTPGPHRKTHSTADGRAVHCGSVGPLTLRSYNSKVEGDSAGLVWRRGRVQGFGVFVGELLVLRILL